MAKAKGQFLDLFRRHNVTRAETRFKHPTDEVWWTNAAAGEIGEACNIAKKISRGDFDEHVLPNMKYKLAIELADAITYCDLLLAKLGYRMEDVLRYKFNIVSERVGYEEEL